MKINRIFQPIIHCEKTLDINLAFILYNPQIALTLSSPLWLFFTSFQTLKPPLGF